MCVFSGLSRFSRLSLKNLDCLVTFPDLRGLQDLGGLFIGTRRNPGYTWGWVNPQMANVQMANVQMANVQMANVQMCKWQTTTLAVSATFNFQLLTFNLTKPEPKI